MDSQVALDNMIRRWKLTVLDGINEYVAENPDIDRTKWTIEDLVNRLEQETL